MSPTDPRGSGPEFTDRSSSAGAGDRAAARTNHGALAAGSRVGRYEIRAAIGTGGMGEVYRAYDTQLAREVALKVLPRQSMDSADALARFEREARAVAALSHPNILAIHDVGREGDVSFAVTELLEGETLRARLSSGRPLPPSKAIEYAVQIAHGLAAAHDRGIVHRDLKPENVFITEAGHVKILDFGLARYEGAPGDNLSTIAPLTRTGVIAGTVGYVAPEQLLGAAATPQSDLFALGVVIYEMLTGTHPFRRATSPETQTAILREDPAPLTHAVPALPSAVARIVERCLQKQPTDRPESARDLAMFLEAGVSSTASTLLSAGNAAPVRRDVTRALLPALCGVILLTTAANWGLVRSSMSRAADAAINTDFARAERIVQQLHRDHVDRLALTAQLVAGFPELKALFATDAATVEDFLLAFRQRIPQTPHLIALGPEGGLVARTDLSTSGSDASAEVWLPALSDTTGGSIVTIDGEPHFAAVVASEAAGTIFGYLIASEAVDQALAQAINDATQDEVLLLSEEGVLASTLRARQLPWTSLTAWRDAGGTAGDVLNVEIGSQTYAAREVPLDTDPAVSVILVKPRVESAGGFAALERGVIFVGLLAAALVAGAFLWLRSSGKTGDAA